MSQTEKKLAESWFLIAEEDIKSAHFLYETHLFRNSCFFCQQAVEKYFKGLLSLKNIKFPKTHDLIELNGLLVQNLIDLSLKADDLDLLNTYYIEPRYPDAYFEIYTKSDSKKALEITEVIIKEIKTRL